MGKTKENKRQKKKWRKKNDGNSNGMKNKQLLGIHHSIPLIFIAIHLLHSGENRKKNELSFIFQAKRLR